LTAVSSNFKPIPCNSFCHNSRAASFGGKENNRGSIKHQSWYAISPRSIPAFNQNTVPPVITSRILIAHSIDERPRWRGNRLGWYPIQPKRGLYLVFAPI